MSKGRIKFGIDLGTTNSSIAKMENGQMIILKSDVLKDTMPSCVGFTKKQNIIVGDKALTFFSRDKQFAMKDSQHKTNSFIEFKRTMGTNKTYFSSNTNQSYTSEELSAEVLKKLKSFAGNEENLNSVVITVPAKFTINQKDATIRAAKLAGFSQVELLQEPVAASFAYGLDSSNKGGIWLVFDFGGGTFDAALLRVEDGIMKVFDTEGDNHLGGKNIDYAIIDEFLLPHFEENFSIESFLNSDHKRKIFRDAWKPKMEEAKIELSFDPTYDFGTDFGESLEQHFGEDDEGVPFELDLEITEAELEPIEAPIFQRAIDLTKDLLKRNRLTGYDLKTVILVGGPTYSPILRRMIKEQISEKIDFSVDPMTVVARGAALYASTISVSEEVADQTRNRSKIQLEVSHEPMTVEDEEYVTVKLLRDKTDGIIPDSLFIELARTDKAWTSEQISLSPQGELIMVKLNSGKVNVFKVNLFDDKGNRLPCEPEEINIIQGTVVGDVPIASGYGIGVVKNSNNKKIYDTIKGLGKNTPNAKGTTESYKTQISLHPGNENDFISIPIYEGDFYSQDTRAEFNNQVYEFVITGEDVSELIPAGSEIELTFSFTQNGCTCLAFFPKQNLKFPLKTPTETQQKDITVERIEEALENARNELTELADNFYANGDEVEKISAELESIADQVEKSGFEYDTRTAMWERLSKCFRQIDKITEDTEWDILGDNLLERLAVAERLNNKFGNDRTTQRLADFQRQSEQIIAKKDKDLARELLDNLEMLIFVINWKNETEALVNDWDEDFDGIEWKDRTFALRQLKQAQELLDQNRDFEEVRPIIADLFKQLPQNEKDRFNKALLLK